MLSKKELLQKPNYLLTTYQNKIYREVIEFMKSNDLTRKDIAEMLGVSNSYVSQILNGNFNFTLKKLIELGLLIGKVPALEFVTPDEYWRREHFGTVINAPATWFDSRTVNVFLKDGKNQIDVVAKEKLTSIIESQSSTQDIVPGYLQLY